MNRPPHQSAARSNLVGSPTSSQLVTMAKGGETKAHLSNSSCATRSRRRLVQSNSSPNALVFSIRQSFNGFQNQRLYPMDFFSVNLSRLVQNPLLASTTASGMRLHNPTICENMHCQLSCRYCSLLSKPHPKTLFITRREGPHLKTVSWQLKF